MLKKDLWWLFVLGFVLLIAGIHALSWLPPAPAAPAQKSMAPANSFTTPAGVRHDHCETRHWRKMVMHE